MFGRTSVSEGERTNSGAGDIAASTAAAAAGACNINNDVDMSEKYVKQNENPKQNTASS
jgi:hypothetical protein